MGYAKLTITVLAILMASSSSDAQRNITGWIESPKITQWGTWSENVLCPEETFIHGFRLKLQPDAGVIFDDTAVNGFEFSCITPAGERTIIRGPEGARGSWGSWSECPTPALGEGFELRSEEFPCFDCTAANNLALYCDGARLPGAGHSWGEWSGILHCPTGNHLCGFRSQLAVALPSVNDDSAINNIDFACCPF